MISPGIYYTKKSKSCFCMMRHRSKALSLNKNKAQHLDLSAHSRSNQRSQASYQSRCKPVAKDLSVIIEAIKPNRRYQPNNQHLHNYKKFSGLFLSLKYFKRKNIVTFFPYYGNLLLAFVL